MNSEGEDFKESNSEDDWSRDFDVYDLDEIFPHNRSINELQGGEELMPGLAIKEENHFSLLLNPLINMVEDMMEKVGDNILALEDFKKSIHLYSPKFSHHKNMQKSVKCMPIFRPFFIQPDGFRPPMNEDTKARGNWSEHNLADIKRYMGKIWNKKEANKIIQEIGQLLLLKKVKQAELLVNSLAIKRDAACDPGEARDYLLRLQKARVNLQKLNDATPYEILTKTDCTMEEIDHCTDWHRISNSYTHRRVVTPENCRLAWIHFLNPQVNTSAWKTAECNQLVELVKLHGKHNWSIVAQALETNRTPFACFEKWQKLEKSLLERKWEWTLEKDEQLLSIVSELMNSDATFGIINWNRVSILMTPRVPAYNCRQRWKQIHPSQRNVEFTEEEDLNLLMSVHRFGPQWDIVAHEMPGRVNYVCQKRYLDLMEAVQPWSYMEDRKLYYLLVNILKDSNPPYPMHRLCRYALAVLPRFPGRNVRAVARRWRTLIHWSNLWDRLRQAIKGIAVDTSCIILSDKLPTEPWTAEDIRGVLLRTPFVLNLLKQLHQTNQGQPIQKLIHLMRTFDVTDVDPGDDLKAMFHDIKNGIFIPRPIVQVSYKGDRRNFCEMYQPMLKIIADAQAKHIVDGVISGYLEQLLHSTPLSAERDLIVSLLGDECHYWIRLQDAWSHSSLRAKLDNCNSSKEYILLIPKLVEIMAKPWNYAGQVDGVRPYLKEDISRSLDNISSNKSEKVLNLLQLVQQYRHGASLSGMRKNTFPETSITEEASKHCLFFRFLPHSTSTYLLSPAIRQLRERHACMIYKRALCPHMDATFLTNSSAENAPTLKAIPPSYATIQAFQHLQLRRALYIHESGTLYSLFRSLNSGSSIRTPLTPHRKINCEDLSLYRSILNSPQVRLFKARMFAVLLWPALVSQIPYSLLTENKEERIKHYRASCGYMEQPEATEDEDESDPCQVQVEVSSSREKRSIQKIHESEFNFCSEVRLDREIRKQLREDAMRALVEENKIEPPKKKRKLGDQTLNNSSNMREEATRDVHEFNMSSMLYVPLSANASDTISTIVCLPKSVLSLMAAGFSIYSLTTSREQYEVNNTADE